MIKHGVINPYLPHVHNVGTPFKIHFLQRYLLSSEGSKHCSFFNPFPSKHTHLTQAKITGKTVSTRRLGALWHLTIINPF